jgi:hypothetical protein
MATIEPRDRRATGHWRVRVGWFALIWAASVVSLGAVAWALRNWLN